MIGAEHDSLAVRPDPLEQQALFGVVLLEDVAPVPEAREDVGHLEPHVGVPLDDPQASSKRGKSEWAKTTGKVGNRRASSSIVAGGRLKP
jgi:hypothetical protein